MHQVFAIFLRDVKRILKNPVALVVTLGVAIIPSLYAWCNILANWDPYANTGNIQVAVANEDKGTTSTLVGHLDAGQQTVNQLKKNHQLGWRFVPEQQAIEGVESGKYYAAIVLPEDFSSRLIGTVTGKGDRPSITYYINEKLNAIAPKITDTGATTIDEQINTTFVSSVADAVAKEVKEAAGETTGSMKSAQSDVINDLTDTINQLETVQQQLRGTRSTLDKALTTIDSAKQSNIALASGITNSLDTVGKASDLLSETRTQTERFSNTLVGALDNGSTQLSGLQVNVSNATGTVLSGLNTTQDALDQVSSTMHHVNTTTGNVLDGVEKALQASQLDPNNQTYKDLSAQLAEARKQLTFQQQPSTPSIRTPRLRSTRGRTPRTGSTTMSPRWRKTARRRWRAHARPSPARSCRISTPGSIHSAWPMGRCPARLPRCKAHWNRATGCSTSCRAP